MSQIKVCCWTEDGGAVYIPCGFEPDFLLAVERGAASGSAVFYVWFYELTGASTPKDGWSITDGTDAELADGSGFDVYDTGTQLPTIADWVASTAYTARSATANGSFVRPTQTSGEIANDEDGVDADRSAIFECVTAGTSGSSEPAWPVANGENSASDNGVIWQKVAEPTFRGGYQGFSIAAALQTDGQEMYALAIQADSVEDFGDVDGWTGGIKGA